MRRDPTWGQDDPVSQLRVILVSIEGDLMNVEEGVASGGTVRRALKHTRDASLLAEAISRGDCEWDP